MSWSFGLGSNGRELPESGGTEPGSAGPEVPGKSRVGESGNSESFGSVLDLGGSNSPLPDSDGLLKGGGAGVSTSSTSLGGSLSDSLGAAGFGVAGVGPSDFEPDDLGGAGLGLDGFDVSVFGTDFGGLNRSVRSRSASRNRDSNPSLVTRRSSSSFSRARYSASYS